MAKIEPHKTYILTHDVTNPNADRRKTHDWRAVPLWKAGTRFYTSTEHLGEKEFVILYTGKWIHNCVYEASTTFLLLAEHLQEAPADFDSLLHYCKSMHSESPYYILENLFETGKVSSEDIIEASKRISRKESK